MRLFVGISIPEDVATRVGALVDRLRPLAALRWSHTADLHVTTKFIGEEPPTRLAEIERALGALPPREPFPLSVRHVGWFPNADAPRVFWAGVEATAGLAELAAETERVLASLGVAIQHQQYSPHVTLARVRTNTQLEALRQALVAFPSSEFGAFTVESFTLYESRLADSRVNYLPLATFPLGRPSQAGV
jgi:2'-5' RNA ligase